MPYNVLSQDEQDEIIVAFMQAQERDLFCHQLNLERYNRMLETLADGEFKSHITKLRDETAKRLAEVQAIIAATECQLPPQERIEAAKTRIASKERRI
jgi:hypothetical protein